MGVVHRPFSDWVLRPQFAGDQQPTPGLPRYLDQTRQREGIPSTPRVADLEARSARPAPGTLAELEGLPAPVPRYFSSAIAPGTPLALSARLRMQGATKI